MDLAQLPQDSSTKSFPVSCIQCRRRKIKCNRGLPCDQCIKRTIPDQCKFPQKFRARVISGPIPNPANMLTNGLSDMTLDENHPDWTSPSAVSSSTAVEHNVEYFFDPSGKYFGPDSAYTMISPWRTSLDKSSGSKNSVTSDDEEGGIKLRILFTLRVLTNSKENISFLRYIIDNFFTDYDHSSFIDHRGTLDIFDRLQAIGSKAGDNSKLLWQLCDDCLLLCIIIATSCRSLDPNDSNVIQSGLAPQKLSALFWERYRLLRNCISSESLRTVQASCLEFEYAYHLGALEYAWMKSYNTLAAAYSLGLHSSDDADFDSDKIDLRNSIWAAVDHNDALIASVMGRPSGAMESLRDDENSIYNQIKLETSTAIRNVSKNLLLCSRNSERTDYQKVLVADIAVSDAALSWQKFCGDLLTSDIALTSPSILLGRMTICLEGAHAKLHQPHFFSHPYSVQQIVRSVEKCCISADDLVAFITGVPIYQQFPMVECFFYQALVALFIMLRKMGPEIVTDPQFSGSFARITKSLLNYSTEDWKWTKNITAMFRAISDILQSTDEAQEDYAKNAKLPPSIPVDEGVVMNATSVNPFGLYDSDQIATNLPQAEEQPQNSHMLFIPYTWQFQQM